MRLTLLFLVALVVALAVVLILGSINAGRVDFLAQVGVEPGATFSTVEYTGDFAVVHHIEFGTPLDYARGLPEVYRLTMPGDKAVIDAIVAALRDCREADVRPELANSDAICMQAADGERVPLAVGLSEAEAVVYLDHCKYRSRDLYALLDRIVATKRGLARRKWCERR